MGNIAESVKVLASTIKHKDVVDRFAQKCYDEKFVDVKYQEGTFHAYDGFEVLTEHILKVKFVFGAGDMAFNGSFNVEINNSL